MYLGFQGLRATLGVLPDPVARSVGSLLGRAAGRLLVGQRRLVEAHLAQALSGVLSPNQRRAVARRVFINLGRTAAEWLRFPHWSRAHLQRLVRAEGVDHVRQALAEGRGAIVVSGHFGNWEMGPAYFAGLGFEGAVLARRLRYPEYEEFLYEARRRHGVPTLARGSLKEVAEVLRRNHLIGMLPDQDVDSLEGIFVDFFGRPAYTPVGPAALSVVTGAPIIPCFVIREPNGFRLVVEPALRAPSGVSRTESIRRLTEAWSRVVEGYIRRYPDQWVWMHRRWKTRPPATEPGAPRETRGGDGSAGAGSRARPTEPGAPADRQGGETVPGRAGATAGRRTPRATPALALVVSLVLGTVLLASGGCAKKHTAAGEAPDETMSTFTLSSFSANETKRWQLEGQGATVEDGLITIFKPQGVRYDPTRTAYLEASVAQVMQHDRRVRMEHDVTIHTSDGLWFFTPILYWTPDKNRYATDQPVRIETDHMLLRGRESTGSTELKEAQILHDVEMVLNPSDADLPGGKPGGTQVTITCDGPLTFDYEHHIATFEQHVHVKDPSGDLFSDKLVAYLDPATNTIRYAEAIGRVKIYQEDNTAESERAVYEPAFGKITLVGRPSLLIFPSGETPGVAFGGLVSTPAQTAAVGQAR